MVFSGYKGDVLMERRIGAISSIVVKSAVAIACTVLLGLLFDGWSIFSYYNSAFEFVSYGILGSLFFFSLTVNVRDSFALLLVLLFVQCGLITKSFASIFFVRDIIYFAMVSISILVFFFFFHKPKRQGAWLEPLILATVMGVGFFFAIVILHVVRGVVFSFEQLRSAILSVAERGFLIGLGIGLGIFLVGTKTFERIQGRLKPHES